MIFIIYFITGLLLIAATCFIARDSGIFTAPRIGILCGGLTAILILSSVVVYYDSVNDTEILNGVITDKRRERVSCEHSYKCHCYTTCSGTGSNRSCSEHCSTCYEHSYDISWVYDVDYGFRKDTDAIAREDRQGLICPWRWAHVRIGEPASTPHTYSNYVKAAPHSLFRRQGSIRYDIPEYPGKVYDYYRINRVVTTGPQIDSAWNSRVAQINGVAGPQNQASVAVVITQHPENFFYDLEQAWLGGKKNDVVIVIGVKDKEIAWVRIMAWTDSSHFKVVMRDEIIEAKILDTKVFDIIAARVKEFRRKPMADFEYLRSEITPTFTQSLVVGVLCLVFLVGLNFYFFWEEGNG